MASFQKYLPKLLQLEGGYQNNPNDPGNFTASGKNVGTKYGISGRFYEQYIGEEPTVKEIKDITKNKAAEIYKNEFWNLMKADQIKSQKVAETIVDHQVNAGGAAKMAQKVLRNKMGKNIAIDGSVGSETLGALNSVNSTKFLKFFNGEREDHYKSQGNSTFEAGWLSRLDHFKSGRQAGTFLTVVGIGVTAYLLIS